MEIKQIAQYDTKTRKNSNRFRVYDTDGLEPTLGGISPTLTARDYKGSVKVLIKNATKKGYLIAEDGDGIDTAYPDSKTRRGRVQKNMAHTLTTDDSKAVIIQKPRGFNKGGTHINSPSITKSSWQENNFLIAASRGRYPKNPSDRKAGNINLQQRLEINKNGTSNTITSVQKDNYVVEQVRRLAETARPNIEPRAVKLQNSNMKGRRIKEQGEPMFTVTVGEETTRLRIRKLTPKECWRLMGCSDEDFEKAEQVNSNSQLYKQAGNAIVVDVLEAIFNQLFLKNGTDDNI